MSHNVQASVLIIYEQQSLLLLHVTTVFYKNQV